MRYSIDLCIQKVEELKNTTFIGSRRDFAGIFVSTLEKKQIFMFYITLNTADCTTWKRKKKWVKMKNYYDFCTVNDLATMYSRPNQGKSGQTGSSKHRRKLASPLIHNSFEVHIICTGVYIPFRRSKPTKTTLLTNFSRQSHLYIINYAWLDIYDYLHNVSCHRYQFSPAWCVGVSVPEEKSWPDITRMCTMFGWLMKARVSRPTAVSQTGRQNYNETRGLSSSSPASPTARRLSFDDSRATGRVFHLLPRTART